MVVMVVCVMCVMVWGDGIWLTCGDVCVVVDTATVSAVCSFVYVGGSQYLGIGSQTHHVHVWARTQQCSTYCCTVELEALLYCRAGSIVVL